jgi:hypothetical protein
MFSASMMFHCIASIYYADSSFDGRHAVYLEISLIVVNLGVVAIAVGLYIMSLLEDKFKTAAVTGLAGGVANLIVSLQLEMRGQAQSLLRTLDEATRATPPLAKGCRVSHPTNGLGVVTAVVLDNARGKLFVLFDSGEPHHYSVESASKTLQAYKDRGDAPEDAVLLDEFQQGVQQCLQRHHISPAALEALFLMLKFLDAEENAEVYTTQTWVSMRVVSISATSAGLCVRISHAPRLQVREFLGEHPSSKTRSLVGTISQSAMGRLHSRLSRLSPVGAAALQNAVIVQEIASRPHDGWNSSLVKKTTLKLCAEIQNSVKPAAFRRWTRRNRGNESSMAAFFCFCCWVAPHIPDDAEVGVYSRTLAAKVYRTAARRIPEMILVAAFGEAAGVRSMQGFMRLWEHAERTLSDDFRLLGSLDERDHGPFLFWLLNERVWLPSAVLASRQPPASCLGPKARVNVVLLGPGLGLLSFLIPARTLLDATDSQRVVFGSLLRGMQPGPIMAESALHASHVCPPISPVETALVPEVAPAANDRPVNEGSIRILYD